MVQKKNVLKKCPSLQRILAKYESFPPKECRLFANYWTLLMVKHQLANQLKNKTNQLT